MLNIRYKAGSITLTDRESGETFDLNSPMFSPEKRGRAGNFYPELHRSVCLSLRLVT